MRRALLTLTIAGSLTLAACGGDDDDAAETTAAAATTMEAATTKAPTPTDAATTTAKSTTTTAAATTTTKPAATTTTAAAAVAGYVPGADAEADAAALAWTTVFDSSLAYDAKAAHIADAEALKATIDGYTQAGQAVGGIALSPTGVVVSGDTAAISYDVTFAGQPAYEAQDGTIQRVSDTWQVSREEFCGFMAAARNPCP